jgi:hypothetical protein
LIPTDFPVFPFFHRQALRGLLSYSFSKVRSIAAMLVLVAGYVFERMTRFRTGPGILSREAIRQQAQMGTSVLQHRFLCPRREDTIKIRTIAVIALLLVLSI